MAKKADPNKQDMIATTNSHCSKYIQVCRSFLISHKLDILIFTTESLVNHPFLVLRRQCQVHGNAQEYHLTPISLVPVCVTLTQRKGFKVMFSGICSVVVLRAVQRVVEKLLSRLTGWGSDWPPTWYVNRAWLNHFLLKFSALIITAPVYSMTVINTVSIPGVPVNSSIFTFCKYDFALSFWQTMLPNVFYRMVKYGFTQTVFSFSSAMFYLRLSFNESKREVCQEVEGGIKIEDREDIFLKASVISYLLAEALFYPLETIVHRLILQGTRTFTNDLDCGFGVVQILSAYDGFFDCFYYVLWLEGKLGLYKGFGAFFLQAIFYHYSIKCVSLTCQYIRIYKNTSYNNSRSQTACS